MPFDRIPSNNVDIYTWAPIDEIEPQATQQLKNTASLPWVFHHVAAMPDMHFGYGATVGSVVATKDAISPACVGVDVGCGMSACKTNLRASALPDNLDAIRHQIERDIPVGFNEHKHSVFDHGEFRSRYRPLINSAAALFLRANMMAPGITQNRHMVPQCGTLGGGNHFIELCLDNSTEQHIWLMLHSGSRNVGKTLAEQHITKAKTLTHNADLPDPDLSVFLAKTPEMAEYRNALMWAQDYARINRAVMLALYKNALLRFFPLATFDTPISCHHNYVAEETHYGEAVYVTRKGAISAKQGELGIIPGSMGTASYIVRGLGCIESFHSASHGAGRRMARGAVKRKYTLADLAAQTAGVCCRKDAGVLDELPSAYKDIDKVMANQSDLVEVVTKLKQVLCVKG